MRVRLTHTLAAVLLSVWTVPVVRAVTFAVSMGSAIALCALVCWVACRAQPQAEQTQIKKQN